MKRTLPLFQVLTRSLAVALILSLGGCFLFADDNISPTEELTNYPGLEDEFYAKPGDVLLVKVWGEPRVSGEVFVREDGRFTLNLIGDVDAEGKTLMQLTDEVSENLKEFIPSASVVISVIQMAPIRYFMAGQFLKPGEYRSDGKITMLQAIATSGGFAPFADSSRVTLIRKSPTGEKRYRLDYGKVVSGNEPNPELKNGDFISVE